jgi:hypothetical protein
LQKAGNILQSPKKQDVINDGEDQTQSETETETEKKQEAGKK